jgi:hypothetical protein
MLQILIARGKEKGIALADVVAVVIAGRIR